MSSRYSRTPYATGGSGIVAESWATVPDEDGNWVNVRAPAYHRIESVADGYVKLTYWGSTSGGSSNISGSSSGFYTSQTETVCEPAVAGSPGIPPKVITTGVGPDWLSYARSIRTVVGDAVAAFDLPDEPNVVIGFGAPLSAGGFASVAAGVAFTTTPTGVTISPIKGGEVGDPVGYYFPGERITLLLRGGVLDIYSGTRKIHSEPDMDPPAVVSLNALLYSVTDYVENPAIQEYEPVTGLYVNIGVTPRIAFDWVDAKGAISLDGSVHPTVDGVHWASVKYDIGLSGEVYDTTMGAEVSSLVRGIGLAGTVNYAQNMVVSRLPSFAMASADTAYANIIGYTPAITCTAYMQAPAGGTSAGVMSLVPSLYGAIVGTSGGIGSISGSVRPLVGIASDTPYATISGAIPPLQARADSGVEPPGYAYVIGWMFLADRLYCDPVYFVKFISELSVEATASAAFLVEDAVVSALSLSDTVSLTRFLSALAESGLKLIPASSAPAQSELYRELGIMLDTGAVTRYEGMAFAQFAYTNVGTYAIRGDGLYLLRPGDDDGAERSALLTLPTSDFGTSSKKHLDAVFLGLDTDGTAYVKAIDDRGRERTYRVKGSRPTKRVNLGRGITAREWELSLVLVDAKEAELVDMELVVHDSGRRWVK